MLYFAYASNLSKGYMASRCPTAIPVKKAVLKNYKLTFNELADIVEAEEEYVLGALYVISKQDLEQLDILEGYPDLYNRIIVEVEGENGDKYDAYAYTMIDKDLKSPPDHYYEILLEGYQNWDLRTETLLRAKKLE